MRRPIYLVIALAGMCFIGMYAVATGYFTVEVIHNPLAVPMTGTGRQAVATAMVRALRQRPRVNLPMGVAQILLGGALVLVSLKALLWRHASTSFALQVLAANAALAIVCYALREPVRAAAVQAVVAVKIPAPAGISATEFAQLKREEPWWLFRTALGLRLFALALCAFALTRKRARAVLAPAPRPESH